jgi:hypothetical protein
MKMSVPTRRFIWALLAIPLLVFAASVYGFDDTSSGPLVPEGLVIEDVFKPGIGSPVGKVVAVRGEVLIVHEGVLRGYRAQKDLPLFKGDTIIALERGRIKFELNDGSALTLIPETKLTISESVYDPNKKDRSTYIDVSVGKVRSVVTKLSGYKRSVFKVKTPTAVCGVRGSDFITLAMVDISEVTALEDTELGVLSRDFLQEPPLLITDFEVAIVERGKRPRKEGISRDKAEQLKKEFLFLDELIERGREEEVVEKPGEKYEEEGVLVPEYELVKPGRLERPERPRAWRILEREGVAGEDEEMSDVRTSAAEMMVDAIVEQGPAGGELPPFPGPPL